MAFLVAIAIIVGLTWAAVFFRSGTIMAGCLVFLVVGYCLGHPLIHFDLGPIPLTLERVVLVALAACFLLHRRYGRIDPKPWTTVDTCLFVFVGWLAASHFLSDSTASAPGELSPTWRLIAGYLIPLAIYWMARQAPLTERTLRMVLGALACFGIYLAATAIAEIHEQWWMVYPQYISNPELGIHFGRARGPALASYSLGFYLSVCLLCAWLLRNHMSRPVQLLFFLTYPVFLIAIYYTYTRAAWLAAAAGLTIVVGLKLHRAWRPWALAASVAAGLLVIPTQWDRFVGFERETSASDTRHSVYQRASFTYVSWWMFKDRPISGHGFGQFYQAKKDYLANRSVDVELDSIRELQHHNTFLGLLTETGLVGLCLFLSVLIGWLRYAWSLSRDLFAPKWARTHGILMIGVLSCYAIPAVFHDLSLSPYEHPLLFFLAGITVGLWSQTQEARNAAGRTADHDKRFSVDGRLAMLN